MGLITWSTPPPTSIDERLFVSPNRTAVLAALRPRINAAMVGSFHGSVDAADAALLSGPESYSFDLLHPDPSPVFDAAERAAASARQHPFAVARFTGGGTARPGVGQRVALSVTGAGKEQVEFELDPDRCAVHFLRADGQPVSWVPFPRLPIGFVTPDAEGLGGVRNRGKLPTDTIGTIGFDCPFPAGAVQVRLQVAGRLHKMLPNVPEPLPFEAVTESRPLPR